MYDAALTKIAKAAGLDIASALKLAALKGTTEGCVMDGKLMDVVPRLVEKAWESELKALQKNGVVGKDRKGKVPEGEKQKVAELFETWKADATVHKEMAGLGPGLGVFHAG